MVCLIVGGFTILISGPLTSLFKLSPEGSRYAQYVMIIFGATMFIDMFTGSMITGFLRGGGDTKFAMYVESGCVWLVAVPMAFLSALVWHLPIHLALLMTRTELIFKSILLGKRFISKKWMNTVIEDL